MICIKAARISVNISHACLPSTHEAYNYSVIKIPVIIHNNYLFPIAIVIAVSRYI